MDKTQVLGAIKALFGVETTPAEPMPSVMDRPEDFEVFVDVKTVDGLTLRVTEMALGAECYHIGEDGVETLCAEGSEYVLESGEKIEIGPEGRIASIEMPEEEIVDAEEDMGKKEEYSEEEAPAEEEAPVAEEAKETFASQSDIDTLRQANILLAEKLDELSARLETFAKAPSAEPVVTTTAFNKAKTVLETKEDRLKFFGSK